MAAYAWHKAGHNVPLLIMSENIKQWYQQQPQKKEALESLAKATGRSFETAKSWIYGKRNIPVDVWPEVSELTGVSEEKLYRERRAAAWIITPSGKLPILFPYAPFLAGHLFHSQSRTAGKPLMVIVELIYLDDEPDHLSEMCFEDDVWPEEMAQILATISANEDVVHWKLSASTAERWQKWYYSAALVFAARSRRKALNLIWRRE